MKELVDIYTWLKKYDSQKVLSLPIGYGLKMEELLGHLDEDTNLDSKEISTILYDNPNSPGFKKLRSRLRDKLLNQVFQIELSNTKFTHYHQSYHRAYRQYALVQLLLERSARHIAIPLAERTLKKAIRYEMTELCLLLSKDLRLHYGTINLNLRKYKQYSKLFTDSLQLFEYEMQAELYYSDIAKNYVKSRSAKDRVAILATTYTDELESLPPFEKSYKFSLAYFLVKYLSFDLSNNVSEAIKVCTEANKFFKKKIHINNIALFAFQFYELGSQVRLKNFTRSFQLVEQCLSLVDPGTLNWFITMEYQLIICMRMGRYYEGAKVCLSANKFLKQASAHKGTLETWKIYEIYLLFLSFIGKLDHPSFSSTSVRIGKFINEVPTYSKDKRGLNIAILIVHTLFLIVQKKYLKVINRIDALNLYCYRYLKRDETFRSNCFIKMMIQIPKANFHKNGVIRKTGTLLNKLISVPIETTTQASEMEIIPYEELWDIIIENLEVKFTKLS